MFIRIGPKRAEHVAKLTDRQQERERLEFDHQPQGRSNSSRSRAGMTYLKRN